MHESWAFDGGPGEEELRRLVIDEQHSDTEIAAIYGVARQTVMYWRLKAGIPHPGRGHGPRAKRRAQRYSHKDTIHWRVRVEDMNHPVRKRLVDYSLRKQGEKLAPDAEGRLDDFLDKLRRFDVVIDYRPDNIVDGRREPFVYVPRDPTVDAEGDIVRR